jgi:hypothetical protein
MAPTNCHAESRGSCVSVSRVITYFTLDKTPVSPTMQEKGSLEPPRSRAFKAASFPRLRS